MIIISS